MLTEESNLQLKAKEANAKGGLYKIWRGEFREHFFKVSELCFGCKKEWVEGRFIKGVLNCNIFIKFYTPKQWGKG
jgi:hypothetical protein